MNITIRNLQEAIFRRFKARAAEENMKLGDALTQAMEMWLRRKDKVQKSKFTDIPTFSWGKGTEHSSSDIDKVLYG